MLGNKGSEFLPQTLIKALKCCKYMRIQILIFWQKSTPEFLLQESRHKFYPFCISLLSFSLLINFNYQLVKTPIPVPGKELAAFLPRSMKSLWKKNKPNNDPRFSASCGGFLNQKSFGDFPADNSELYSCRHHRGLTLNEIG